jgi:hypothetical protein
VAALGGTTALLLLCVFTLVNVAVIVLRRTLIEREHFRAPAILPYFGAGTCAFLVGPVGAGPDRVPDRRRADRHRHRAVDDHLGLEAR